MAKKVVFGIEKTIEISAGHYLKNVPEGHPCATQHGHNYSITLKLEATELDAAGFIIDFNILKDIVKIKLDHVNLNDVMHRNPTAENIALHVAELVNAYLFQTQADKDVKLIGVTVQETKSGAAYVRIVETKE